ncbi:ABC transporter permease [Winkia neuii]|uniref:ABC3 transporter permease protein domain-containing protein n=6 Tax=Bacillati TaxID=1783272 RepID=K0YMU9_9ACTO|nr:ABC transporter permease [Winkia neuii]EJZ84977.1 hypothetical protein HMPREF9240_01874 [Winkia neuii BV029A5]
MLKVTLRGIKAHFGRFLLTMLAVALGIAFLSGTLSLRQVLDSNFKSLTASSRTADIYVVGPKISSSSSPLTMRDQVPLDLQEKVQKVQGVSEVRPYYVSIAVLMKQDGTPLRTAGTATAQVVEPGPGGPKLVSGKAPAKNQVAIPHKDAKKLGVKIGDKVKFVVEGTPLDFTVSGFYKLPIDIQAYQIVYMNPEQARSLLGASGKSMYLSVSKNKGASTTAVVHNINKVLDRGTEAMTASKLADEDNKTIDQVLGFVNTFLLVFVLLALFVGTFIIGNTFQMSVKARTKEFALMRAVGVSSGQIFLSVALESVVIGLIGSIIGVALGAGLLAAMGALISAAGLPLKVGGAMSLGIILLSMAIGTVVTVLGALLPARHAASIAPIEAMRTAEGANEKPLTLRTIVGVILTAAGLFLTWTAATGKVTFSQPGIMLGVGAAALLFGIIALLPILARPIAWLLAWPLRIFRPHGRLGLRNVLRSPRRIASTAGALLIGMALVSAGSTLASSVRDSTADQMKNELKASLIVRTIEGVKPTALTKPVKDKILQVEGVKSLNDSLQMGVAAGYGPKQTAQDASPLLLGRFDADAMAKDLNLAVTAGNIANLGEGKIALSDSADKDMKVGTKVHVIGSSGTPRELTVVARYDSAVLRTTGLVSPAEADNIGLSQTVSGNAFLRVNDPKDHKQVERIQKDVQDILKKTYTFEVMTPAELDSATEAGINQTMGILYGLLGLSIVIAILGIINTLSLSVSERTREIGLMRAVGMSRLGIAGTITIESVLITIFGALTGIITGCYLGWALLKYLGSSGINTISIPWPTIAILAVGSILVGIIAAIIPAASASRKPILDAITEE